MDAGASALPTTVEEALAAGFTQEQIDEHLKLNPVQDKPKEPLEDLAKNGTYSLKIKLMGCGIEGMVPY